MVGVGAIAMGLVAPALIPGVSVLDAFVTGMGPVWPRGIFGKKLRGRPLLTRTTQLFGKQPTSGWLLPGCGDHLRFRKGVNFAFKILGAT